MTAHGDVDEFEPLDAVMHTAHKEALGVLAARIDIEERLRQLVPDVENRPERSRGPGSNDT
jgi:hypothetical protein